MAMMAPTEKTSIPASSGDRPVRDGRPRRQRDGGDERERDARDQEWRVADEVEDRADEGDRGEEQRCVDEQGAGGPLVTVGRSAGPGNDASVRRTAPWTGATSGVRRPSSSARGGSVPSSLELDDPLRGGAPGARGSAPGPALRIHHAASSSGVVSVYHCSIIWVRPAFACVQATDHGWPTIAARSLAFRRRDVDVVPLVGPGAYAAGTAIAASAIQVPMCATTSRTVQSGSV